MGRWGVGKRRRWGREERKEVETGLKKRREREREQKK